MLALRNVMTRLGPGCSRLLSSAKLPEVIDFVQFETLREEGKAFIIDVRQPEELKEIGAIPNVINIPLPDIHEVFTLKEELFEGVFGRKYPEPDDPIVTFCMMGVRSDKAKGILMQQHGFSNVANYKGSFTDWKAKSH